MESSNNIIHPTRLKGLAFGTSCFGRVMMSVQVLELLIIHDYSGRFSALPSQPTNKPQLSPGLQVSEVEVNHPFGNRSSQNAGPRLQTAWPLACS
jgi:hypothetical protein